MCGQCEEQLAPVTYHHRRQTSPHTLTPSHPHTQSQVHVHSQTITHSPSLIDHTPYTLTYPHSLIPSLSHTLTPSLSHINPQTITHLTPSLSYSHSPTLTPSLPHTLTFTPSLPHINPQIIAHPQTPLTLTPSHLHTLTPSHPHSSAAVATGGICTDSHSSSHTETLKGSYLLLLAKLKRMSPYLPLPLTSTAIDPPLPHRRLHQLPVVKPRRTMH